jgi:predicted patatin/cPLA2 family phospholipase
MRENIAEVFGEMLRRRGLVRGSEILSGRTTKLGLVVEGGAMRGAASMAYLAALHRHQMNGVFDGIFAESSGAINAAYFVAGQAEVGLELYRLALHSPRFVRNWPMGRMLDLDAVFEAITSGELSLNYERLRRSHTVVQVSLTDATHGVATPLPLQGSDQRISTILKATSAIVPFYNRPVLLDGRGFVDGGISDPVPVLRAIEAGCSHILVLLTRPENYQPRRLRLWERAALRVAVARWGAEFRHVFHHARQQRYNRSRAIALGREEVSRAVHIAAIAPSARLGKIERFFADADRLHTVVETCLVQMESVITDSTAAFTE